MTSLQSLILWRIRTRHFRHFTGLEVGNLDLMRTHHRSNGQKADLALVARWLKSPPDIDAKVKDNAECLLPSTKAQAVF